MTIFDVYGICKAIAKELLDYSSLQIPPCYSRCINFYHCIFVICMQLLNGNVKKLLRSQKYFWD